MTQDSRREIDTHALARRLFEAFESGSAMSPLTEQEPSLEVGDAYEVQKALVELHREAGRRVVARKVGLTSKAMQSQLGVDQPDYGVVFDSHVFENGATLSYADHVMIAPKVEAELAFVLDEELRGPGVDAVRVLASTRAVVPALEIIDSRVSDWQIKLPDTVADNASGWGIVLGEVLTPADGMDLTTVGMVLDRDGEVLATGAGAAVYDHPARAVAWLANTLAGYGDSLPAGEPILSGSFTAAVDGLPGRYRARFGAGLGTVEVNITG